MKVFCIGDASVNVFLQIPENTENVSVDGAARTMNFRLGSKTQLAKEAVTVGGNALNVAVGLARQGIQTKLFSIIGDDYDGMRISEFFSQEVESSKLKVQNYSLKLKVYKTLGVKTNVGYIVNFKNERFILQDTSAKQYNLSSTDYRLQTTDWLFLSSIGPNYEDFFKDLIELKKKIGFKLAYNPSSNELAQPVETYVGMIEASDVLFVNKREAEKILFSVGNGRDRSLQKIEDFLEKIRQLNKNIVVITDGQRGSWAYDGVKMYYEASSGETAIEKTGAGDAYESGFLAEYLKTGDIHLAMKNGTENAGSVIQRIGAVEGLQYKK